MVLVLSIDPLARANAVSNHKIDDQPLSRNISKNSPYRQTDFNINWMGQFMLAQVGQF